MIDFSVSAGVSMDQIPVHDVHSDGGGGFNADDGLCCVELL